MVHGVGMLDWTANSPDLNHIENLWGIVKRQINHVIRLLPENSAVLKSWRIPDSLTPSLSACEEKSKAMASRVPHTRAYGNITSNTGAQRIHSDEQYHEKPVCTSLLFTLLFIKSQYTVFVSLFFIVFFAHLVVFLHISLSFAHLIVFCTSYCFALFYFIAHFTLISPFLTICMPLCYVTYTICILIVLHCPLSGPDSIAFHF